MEDLSGADLRDRGAEVETLPEPREHILLAEEECELPGGRGSGGQQVAMWNLCDFGGFTLCDIVTLTVCRSGDVPW